MQNEQDLLRFNGDDSTKESVLSYLIEYFELKLVEEARAGKDIKALAEAINKVEDAFPQLSIHYGIKQKHAEQITEAR